MKEKCYWAIVCDNFCDRSDVYYFTSYKVAKANFDKIINEHQDEEEFSCDDRACTWYDSQYNENSTFIYLIKKPLPEIHDDIIF